MKPWSWFLRWQASVPRQRKAAPRRPRQRPLLEQLEGRLLPALALPASPFALVQPPAYPGVQLSYASYAPALFSTQGGVALGPLTAFAAPAQDASTDQTTAGA